MGQTHRHVRRYAVATVEQPRKCIPCHSKRVRGFRHCEPVSFDADVEDMPARLVVFSVFHCNVLRFTLHTSSDYRTTVITLTTEYSSTLDR